MKTRGAVRKDYPMARLSTWGVGGAARLLFSPVDMDDLLAFMADKNPHDVLFVGHGSNLLVRDGGVDGVVVRTAPGLSQMRAEGGEVYAEAGVGCPKLARFCAKNKFTGAEFFAGVPGTIGGALAMNAGCYGGETWHAVLRVRVITNGEVAELPRGEFDIGYRYARAKSGAQMIFVAAWFKFDGDDENSAKTTMKEMLRKRGESQPLGQASAGSVFRNPPGGFAGKMIAECGLAGMRVGGAEVSRKHANFIVNRGDATASDIETLMSKVQDAVRDKTGVELIPEVRIVGKSEGGRQ